MIPGVWAWIFVVLSTKPNASRSLAHVSVRTGSSPGSSISGTRGMTRLYRLHLAERLDHRRGVLGHERGVGAERDHLVAACVEHAGRVPAPRDRAEDLPRLPRRPFDRPDRLDDVGVLRLPAVPRTPSGWYLQARTAASHSFRPETHGIMTP